ncbi:toprim domain-containing protein [Capnocytophaga sputigena]|uniref:toprim domain-containing protein n=1 Tax=Capnocytophaga sputigena TaxID=1019 RepID=UPI003C7270E7
MKKQTKGGEPHYLTEEQRDTILNSVDLRDYFMYLASKGIFQCNKKRGKWFYFSDSNSKIAVCEDKWHDFKLGEGGRTLNAVMKFERLNWLEAHYFLANFTNTCAQVFVEERQRSQSDTRRTDTAEFYINQVLKPNHPDLISYFEQERGIPKEIFMKYTRQIHFQLKTENGNWVRGFGLGWKNRAGGYEIKSSYRPTKLGTTDYTELGNPEAKRLFVFEGMCDMLSMATMLQLKGKNLEDYRFICLNSVSNSNSFIKHFQIEGDLKIFLCLDGDKEGEKHTQKLLQAYPNARDIRGDFSIGKEGVKDLNDFWKLINHTA